MGTGRILTLPPNAIGLERGCVEDQPQQLRKTGLLNMPDALEPFIVLRLVLCTQPRSGGRCADVPGPSPGQRFVLTLTR